MSTRTIATKLVLDGEAEYRAKLKNINAELALQKSELEKVQAQYRNSANSMDALTSKQSALEGQLKALDARHLEQSAMLDKARAAQQKYAAQVDEIKGKLSGLADSTENTTEEEAKLRSELTAAEESMQQAGNSVIYYQKQLNNTERDQAKLGTELDKTGQYLDEAKNSADGCAKSIDQYGKEVKQAGDNSEQFGNTSKEAVNQLAAALAAAGVAKSVKEIADALMDCVDTFADFQAQMSAVQAISGASGNELDALAEKAKKMGSTTKFTATEAGKALEYMAMAGWKTGDMLDGLEGVMNLAAASEEDLAATSDIVTDALTAFDLKAEDSGHFADVLAAASANANTNVAMMGETFKYAAPVAGSLGYSVEDTALAIGLMANAGIKGSQAGTALRGTLTNLAKPSDQVARYMEELGISLTDNMGRTRSLSEVIDVLRDRFSNLTEAQQAEYAAGIAGKEAMSGLLAVVNAGEADYQRLKEAIDICNGASERMAETRLDNYAGQMTLLSSAADGLKLALGEQLTPVLTDLAEAGTGALTLAAEFVSENEWVVSAIVGLTGALGALLVGVGALAAAPAIIGALNTALMLLSANPIVLVVSAIVGLTAALATYAASADDTAEENKELIKSLKDSKAAYEDLSGGLRESWADTERTADALKSLLEVEDKSATQKEVILDMVAQLNEAVPELGLAYDAATDSINMTTEALDATLGRMEQQAQYEADVERLSELYAEQTEISARLEEAQASQAEAQQQSGDAMASCFDIAVDYNAALEQGNGAVAGMESSIRQLTEAQEENAAEIAALEEATKEYGDQQMESAAKTQEMTSRVDEIIAEMQDLQEAYEESYNSARENIESQLGLFDKLDGSAKTSIDNLIGTLKGQVSYMETYAANIQRAMEMGVDQGLVKKLSDGSEESAQILAAIVEGGQEDIAALNEQLAKVEEGKENFSQTVAEMETDFSKKMGDIEDRVKQMADELDASSEAKASGRATIGGYIDGANSMRGSLVSTYRSLANAANNAYKSTLDIHSPSRVFREHGKNTILGAIEGAEEEAPALDRAYSAIAESANLAYAAGLQSMETMAALSTQRNQSVAPAAAIQGQTDGADTTIQIYIDRLEVRDDSDIQRIAQKLYYLTERERRSRGGGSL